MNNPTDTEMDFRNQLIQAAVRKEIENSDNADAIAGRHAIRMLGEIIKIIGNNSISSDDKCNEVIKILSFLNVPPHI